ncbi:MAG: hypothetical protein KatS3mg002_0240 [Candidatus Woesearchaeota archaeon]|nr:MAG: hypothetical protein KatS3mg002_0240 [Candidatus Woesearchaeota archaeon]
MIIGFTGKFGCGKTTIAKLLLTKLNHLGYKSIRKAFADFLREEVAELFDIELDDLYHKKTKLIHRLKFKTFFNTDSMTIGTLLQKWGTDIRRSHNLNYWVEKFEKWYLDNKDQYIFVLVDDVRFKNEYDLVKKYGKCVRIYPYPEWEKEFVPKSGRDPNHQSEIDLDDKTDNEFDFVFHPSYGIDYLEIYARQILDEIKKDVL